jgi:hypothetical protein
VSVTYVMIVSDRCAKRQVIMVLRNIECVLGSMVRAGSPSQETEGYLDPGKLRQVFSMHIQEYVGIIYKRCVRSCARVYMYNCTYMKDRLTCVNCETDVYI